jgi:uncharacterized protein YcbX
MPVLGTLIRLWRYPVKSLKAEPLTAARLEADGIPGDRERALFVTSDHARAGKPYRGKEHHLLHTTNDCAAAVAFASARGVAVEVRGESGMHVFDAAPISLIFDSWIDEVALALGAALDPLRWRPNLYVRAASAFRGREADLVGSLLDLGDAQLRVSSTIKRCVTTTYDTNTGEPEHDVLLHVAQKRQNVLGVYCEVTAAGTARAGDLLRLRERAA